MLKILGRANSFNVRKVLWTCDELGIAYEREDWGRGHRSTDDPEFLKYNPNGLVPAVVDGDVVLRNPTPSSDISRRSMAVKNSIRKTSSNGQAAKRGWTGPIMKRQYLCAAPFSPALCVKIFGTTIGSSRQAVG